MAISWKLALTRRWIGLDRICDRCSWQLRHTGDSAASGDNHKLHAIKMQTQTLPRLTPGGGRAAQEFTAHLWHQCWQQHWQSRMQDTALHCQ
jgi:hypothetical protein